MKSTIQTIIQSVIPKECVFDAHTIINYLMQYHNNVYLANNSKEWTTSFYHSEISKTIATFENIIIVRQGECWSKNINDKFTLNKCWIKL